MSRELNTIRRVSLAFAAIVLVAQAALAGGRSSASFPVPNGTIQAGDVVKEDMLTERQLIANSIALRTHYTSRDQVIGKVARRPLAAGAAIPVNGLREPYAFKEGERVVVEYRMGGLRIRGVAIALQPGIVGSSVRARNLDTGVVVDGVVRSDGRLEVGG